MIHKLYIGIPGEPSGKKVLELIANSLFNYFKDLKYVCAATWWCQSDFEHLINLG